MIHSSYKSENIAKELVGKLGENTSYVCADLSDINQLEKIISNTIETFGTVDTLINNAGVFPRNDIFTVKEEDYDYIMNVNYRAPLFLIKHIVNYFKNNSIKGTIVNLGSINAYCGQDNLLVYSCSKSALMTLTRNLGESLSEYEIRVNQLNVGWTHTQKEHETQLQEGNPENWYEIVPKIFAPRGKILQPDEVAKHVVFWASEVSAPVNGSVYEVEQFPVIGRIKNNG